MSFLEAGTKYLKTIESYDRLSAVEKIEANHLLLAYERRLLSPLFNRSTSSIASY